MESVLEGMDDWRIRLFEHPLPSFAIYGFARTYDGAMCLLQSSIWRGSTDLPLLYFGLITKKNHERIIISVV
jgi:hypothetical protein